MKLKKFCTPLIAVALLAGCTSAPKPVVDYDEEDVAFDYSLQALSKNIFDMAANYEVRTNNYKAEVDRFTDRLEKTWTGNELYASAYADDGKYADKIMYSLHNRCLSSNKRTNIR